jgi:hypothetical protein
VSPRRCRQIPRANTTAPSSTCSGRCRRGTPVGEANGDARPNLRGAWLSDSHRGVDALRAPPQGEAEAGGSSPAERTAARRLRERTARPCEPRHRY